MAAKILFRPRAAGRDGVDRDPGNAVVCGTLSNAHDRYGARLAWVPLLVAVLVLLRRRSMTASASRAEVPVAPVAPGAAIPV